MIQAAQFCTIQPVKTNLVASLGLSNVPADDTADIDGDGELTKDELHLAIGSLQAGQLVDDEFDQIWNVLNSKGKPFLSFTEFLEGMVTIKTQPELGLRDKFNLTKPNQLMSLVLDTPVAAWEHDQILSTFDGLEKAGITVLKRHNEEMSTEQKVALMERAQAGTIHELHDGQRERLTKLHNENIWQAFMIGFISCVSVAPSALRQLHCCDLHQRCRAVFLSSYCCYCCFVDHHFDRGEHRDVFDRHRRVLRPLKRYTGRYSRLPTNGSHQPERSGTFLAFLGHQW